MGELTLAEAFKWYMVIAAAGVTADLFVEWVKAVMVEPDE